MLLNQGRWNPETWAVVCTGILRQRGRRTGENRWGILRQRWRRTGEALLIAAWSVRFSTASTITLHDRKSEDSAEVVASIAEKALQLCSIISRSQSNHAGGNGNEQTVGWWWWSRWQRPIAWNKFLISHFGGVCIEFRRILLQFLASITVNH